MAALLQVEVVSRAEHLFSGVATSVRLPVLDGEVGVLPGRQPLLAALSTGRVELKGTDGKTHVIEVEGGFVSVDSDFVTVATERGTVTA